MVFLLETFFHDKLQEAAYPARMNKYAAAQNALQLQADVGFLQPVKRARFVDCVDF